MIDSVVPFKVEHPHRNVCTVRLEVAPEVREWWFLLSADRHHDNPKADHELERRHLELARERRAGIIDAGDLFCAMQGKFDRRGDKDDIRPENQSGVYLDSLVKSAADFYEPFAENFVVIGRGNHETAIRGRHETDLTERLIGALHDRTGANIQSGGYGGWVRFSISNATERHSKTLRYYHGSGGGGPVTKGTIQSYNRLPMMSEGADVILSGHVHEATYGELVRAYVDGNGKPKLRTVHCVQTPTYKEEYGDGNGGWHIERGGPPKPLGAWWMRLSYSNKDVSVAFERAS